METVIASAISALSALVVCVVSNHFQSERVQALIEYRLSELEKKVDKHNNLIDRTYRLEEQTAVQEEKIKVANNRLSDLEDKI